jgi:phosphoribosylformylglycinamidine (FGAM) synthase PurS component
MQNINTSIRFINTIKTPFINFEILSKNKPKEALDEISDYFIANTIVKSSIELS